MHWVPPFLPPLLLLPSHTSISYFPLLPFLPHYYFSASTAIHPFSPLIAVIHHSLSSSSHYYPGFLFLFFTPSLTQSSVTFLSSSAFLIMALLSFYLSVKHNLSSPRPFIIGILFSSSLDPSVLAHMSSERGVTRLDVYLLSTGINPFNNVFIGCRQHRRSRISGLIFA